jgi:hypothetical protein
MDIKQIVESREFINAVANQVSIELEKRQAQPRASTSPAHLAAIQGFSEIADKATKPSQGYEPTD